MYYIGELAKQARRESRETTVTAYLQAMWQRCAPENLPKIDDLLADDEYEPTKNVQSEKEMEEALRTFAARSKAVGRR